MSDGRRPLLAWCLVAAFAATAALLPLVLVWRSAAEQRRAARRGAAGADLPPQLDSALILYAEAWPTREAIDIAEIQGATTESDVILGPRVIASDLALALRDLGVASERRRFDEIGDDGALLARRDVVLVYPVRHGRPPAEVMAFIDGRLEGLVARQEPALARLRLSDVAIAERPERAADAQAALARTLAYYRLAYRPGPALVEAMNSIAIYRQLQALAAELPRAETQRGR